jgi:hypothetical protein
MGTLRARSRGAHLAAALAFWASLALAVPLAAQDPPAAPSEADKARAVNKYDEGVEAFKKRRYKDAVDAFLAADSIAKSGSFAYNIMLSYEQMGDTALSLRWAREYLRRKPGAPDATEIKKRCEGYEAELQKKGVQQVTVMSNVAGATVLIDGKPVGVAPWTGEIAPGNHKLSLQMRDYDDAETQFTMAETHAMDVRLDLTHAKPAAVVPPPPPTTSTPPGAESPKEAPARIGPVTWAGYGVGAAALIVGAATGGASLAKQATIRQACPDHACDASLQGDHDRVIALANASNAMFVLAGVGVAVGTVGLVLDLRKPSAAPAASDGASLRTRIGPGTLGLEGSF